MRVVTFLLIISLFFNSAFASEQDDPCVLCVNALMPLVGNVVTTTAWVGGMWLLGKLAAAGAETRVAELERELEQEREKNRVTRRCVVALLAAGAPQHQSTVRALLHGQPGTRGFLADGLPEHAALITPVLAKQ